MRLWKFILGNVDHEKELDAKLDEYFHASRQYRSSSRRNGLVVVVDESKDTFESLKFIADQCGLKIDIYRFDQADKAVEFIDSIGSKQVKCVLLDSKVVNKRVSFLDKLRVRFPGIPVFVRGDVKTKNGSAGILPETLSVARLGMEMGVIPKEVCP